MSSDLAHLNPPPLPLQATRMATPVDSVQVFGRKKTAVAVAYCKRGRGLIKINGCPVEFVQPEALRTKVMEPILLLGFPRFANVDIRIRVKGGGYTSQLYAIRQALGKSLVAFYQKCESRPLLCSCAPLMPFSAAPFHCSPCCLPSIPCCPPHVSPPSIARFRFSMIIKFENLLQFIVRDANLSLREHAVATPTFPRRAGCYHLSVYCPLSTAVRRLLSCVCLLFFSSGAHNPQDVRTGGLRLGGTPVACTKHQHIATLT